jgi:hypothetical protein
MSLKFKDEIDFATFDNLMEEDANVIYKLSCLASNIKEVVQILDLFLSFLRKYEERKAHNMLPLMLNPRFKTFYLVSSLIGGEPDKTIVEEYEKKMFISSMILKCYYHLHSLVEFERGVVD